ncbi:MULTISPECIES: hypothetical protein [unclassified Bacillus (in: firmicutes)]|nr:MULTISPECIES: hypothetical protein [unclassified Bacillus (in: firmicutes)]
MIIKERKKPIRLLLVEPLLRRLPKEHPKNTTLLRGNTSKEMQVKR